MLYLIDEPYGRNGISLAQKDGEAKLVLIQDGVYIDAKVIPSGIEIYAVKDDV
jgi:sulfur transfer complex TusBCD TusB component (DsrH family)